MTHYPECDMTTIDLIKLDTIRLTRGGHANPDAGLCLMEAVAYVRGIAHTANPPCVSPTLSEYGRLLNDVLPNDQRQLLKPFIPQLPGTAGDGHDKARGYLALDWLIRTYTPAWLDLAGLYDEARSLRELRRIVDLVAAQQAGPVVREAQTKAVAAGVAARVTARAAAGADPGVAARVTARAATGAATGAATEAATGAATGAAIWAAIWAATGATARAATWAATWDVLKPTVDRLKLSAIDLFGRMIAPAGA
jgi:hypothetical protein